MLGIALPDDVDVHSEEGALLLSQIVRSARYRHLSVLHAWSSLPRIRACCARRTDKDAPVGIGTSDGVGSLVGVQTCGSVHACPRCAPKVRNARAGEIDDAARQHLDGGGGLLFLTLTMPHDRGDDLECKNGRQGLWKSVQSAWTDLVDSSTWRALEADYGIALQARATSKPRRRLGVVRSLEVNDGGSGWHPHLHNLIFTAFPLDPKERAHVEETVFDLWCAEVTRRGWRTPTAQHGVDLRPVTTSGDLGQYLAGLDGTRIDMELARGDLKSGRGFSRSPWQILADIANGGRSGTGDLEEFRRDMARWWEYEAASKGKKAITWTHGMKARFGIGEVTDEELAEATTGHVTHLELHGSAFQQVRAAKMIAPLVSAIERGDYAAAEDTLLLAGVMPSLVVWTLPHLAERPRHLHYRPDDEGPPPPPPAAPPLL